MRYSNEKHETHMTPEEMFLEIAGHGRATFVGDARKAESEPERVVRKGPEFWNGCIESVKTVGSSTRFQEAAELAKEIAVNGKTVVIVETLNSDMAKNG